jgi:four helix bundle protein
VGACEVAGLAREFGFEKLTVYQRSMEFYDLARRVVRQVQPRHPRLADQLDRAAASVPLNIAEGASEYRRKEKARIYRIALRSAGESAAALSMLHRAGETSPNIKAARAQLDEIIPMLTALVITFDAGRNN